MGIKTDATSLQGEGRIANFSRRYSRDSNVDGFGRHVLTVQRNSVTMLAEIAVAPRGAIPADDIYLAVGMAKFSQ